MQKSTVAVSLVMVFVMTIVAFGAATPLEASEPPVYEDYEVDFTGVQNFEHRELGGLTYNVMTEAEEGSYISKSNFSCDQLIIYMENVPKNAFLDAKVREVVITEKVKNIETGAFAMMDNLDTVTIYGSPKMNIATGAFTGNDNLKLIDLRSHGTIAIGAFDADYSGLVIVDDDRDLPVWMLNARTADMSDIRPGDVVNTRYSPDKERLSLQFVGQGMIQFDVVNYRVVPWRSVETYGSMLTVTYSPVDMRIEYLEVQVDYGAFGFGRETLIMDRFDVPLKVPGGQDAEGFLGWATDDGTFVGTSFDVEESRSIGVFLDLVPVYGFTVDFDLSGLPAGETASLDPITYAGEGSYPELQSEHYRVSGWVVDGRTFAPGDPIELREDHTAVAVWEVRPDCRYDVTYMNVDGTSTGISENVGYGGTFTIGDVTPEGETDTHILDGWRVDGAGDVLRQGDSFVVTGETRLVPALRERYEHSVTYIVDGDTFLTDVAKEGLPYGIAEDVPEDPARDFAGWAMDGAEGTFGPGDTVTLDGDATLTATWTDKEVHTIWYVADGGTFRTDSAYHGASYRVTSSVPTDADRIFDGWRTADGSIVRAGSTMVVTGDVTLTATWRDRAEYTVTYMVDGEAFLNDTAREGVGYAVTGSVPEIDDGIFVGWKASDGRTYLPGASMTVTGDITLTAEWRERDTYRVEFVTDGGIHRTATAYEGVPFRIDAGIPEGDGMFVGWALDGATYVNGDTIDVDRDVTLTAVWRDRAEYSVRYTVDGRTVISDRAYEGVPYAITDWAPTDENRVFTHWLYDGRELKAGDEISVGRDIVIRAQWRDLTEYTVTYRSIDGTVFQDTAYEGRTYTVSDVVPEDGDGIFVGWRYGGSTLTAGDEVVLTSDATFTAVWRDRAEYRVVYQSMSGTVLEDTAYEGLPYVIRDVVPTDDDGIFVGWSLGVRTLSAGDEVALTSDTTLTAVWRDRAGYVVEYVVDGDTFLTDRAHEGIPYAITDKVPDDGDMIFTHWLFDGKELTAGDEIAVGSDIVIEAQWRDRAKYTVTYVSLGGTVLEDAAREGLPYMIRDMVPDDGDGIFVGWSLDGHDGTLVEGDGVLLTSDATLTAVWRDRIEYTVTYRSVGGTVLEDTAFEGIPYIVCEVTPDDSDGIFDGWGYDGSTLAAGDEAQITSDTVLTAVWRDRAEYTVTFVTDGVFATYTAYEGIPFVIDVGTPVGDGIFIGWSMDGREGVLNDGDTVMVEGDVTLTAAWRERGEHTVTYIVDGRAFRVVTVPEGTTHRVIDDVPTSDGRVFVQWTSGDGAYTAGDEIAVNGDMVLEAQWRDRYEYTVTYIVDGEVFLRDTAYEGMRYTIPDEVPDDGWHIFTGWLLDGRVMSPGDVIDVTSDASMVAQWRDRESYRVSFHTGDGEFRVDTAYEGIPFEIGAGIPAGDRVFVGWHLDGLPGVLRDGDVIDVSGDITLTAEWRDRHEYTVTYMADGRTFATGTAYEGVAYEVIADTPDGYGKVFTHWLISSTGGALSPGDPVMVEGDMVLEAAWRAPGQFTVTYMVDGVTFAVDTVTEGASYEIPGSVPEVGGYRFAGWSLDGRVLQPGETMSVDRDVVLEAVMTERDVFTVTYLVDGEVFLRETAYDGVPYVVAGDVPVSDEGIFVRWMSEDGIPLGAGDEMSVGADMVLRAEWRERDRFTITYVVDGRVFLEDTAYEGVPYMVTDDVPEREGGVFAGWSTDGGLLTQGQTIDCVGDMVLTASWDGLTTFIVTYHDGDGTVLWDTAQAGVPYTVQGWNPSDPDRVFVGWGLGDDVLLPGDTATISGDTTFWAVWRDRAYLEVTYAVDDGTYLVGTAREGLPYTIEDWVPTHPDMVFVGWTTQGIDGALAAGDAITLLEDTVLQAVWRERMTYEVTFMVGDLLFMSAVATEGVPFVIGEGTPEGVEGIFEGWSLEGSDGLLREGDSIVLEGDATFQAAWRDRAEYMVRYVTDDGTVLTDTAYEGLPYSVADLVPTDATRKFVGWSVDGCDGLLSAGDTIPVGSEVTLTAEWRDKQGFTVRYIVDGQVIGSVQHVLEDDTVTIDMTVSSPWAEFLGWTDGLGVYAVGSQYAVTADTTFHAVWGPLDPDGGDGGCGEGGDGSDGDPDESPGGSGDGPDGDSEGDPGKEPGDGSDGGGDGQTGGGTGGGSTVRPGGSGDGGGTVPPSGDDGSDADPPDDGTDPPAVDQPDDGRDDGQTGDDTADPSGPGDGDDPPGTDPDDDGSDGTVTSEDGSGSMVIPAVAVAAIAAAAICILLMVARRS